EREKRATKVVPEEDREEWIGFHIRREQHWFQIYKHLRAKRRTDLTAILIDGTDKLQHICWSSLDPDYFPSQPSAAEALHRTLAVKYYEQLDRFLGEIIADAGPDARIVMVSDHGFGPTEKVFRVNTWLAEKGYLAWGETTGIDADERAKVEKMEQNHFVHVDWAKTTAYCQSAATNGIHIRVARAPGETGIREADYESFRERLIDELLAVRDPDTGTQIVQQVLRREVAFAGEH